MSMLNELYQELIIDHGRHPRHFEKMVSPDLEKEGFNPLCGDRLTLFLKTNHDKITQASFQGSGCAISVASASLMIDWLSNKTFSEIETMFHVFHDMLTKHDLSHLNLLGKLSALQGVTEFPMRVKCATLAWHTLLAAIHQQSGTTTTE